MEIDKREVIDTILLRELIEILDKNSLIPIIQRNYCWGTEKVEDMLKNIINAYENRKDKYTLAMISIYRNSNGVIEIIDGQQRLITLRIIFAILGKAELLNFDIARDSMVDEEIMPPNSDYTIVTKETTKKRVNLMRSNIFANTTETKQYYHTADHKVLMANSEKIYNCLEEKLEKITSDRNEYILGLINYMLNNVQFLLNIVKGEPLSEFLGMNKGKNPFRAYDKARALMLINETDNRPKIIELFKAISVMAFDKEYENILNLISKTNYDNIYKVDIFFKQMASEDMHSHSISKSRELTRIPNLLKLVNDLVEAKYSDLKIIIDFINKNNLPSIIDIFESNISIDSYNKLCKEILHMVDCKKLYVLRDTLLGLTQYKNTRAYVGANNILNYTSDELNYMRELVYEYLVENEGDESNGEINTYSSL